MSTQKVTLAILATSILVLTGCGVAKTTAKVATAPVKVTAKGVGMVGEGVYETGKFAGKGVYNTGKFAGKSAYTVGRGVYYVGSVPVKITDAALDTTARVLRITTQMVDLTGKVVTVSRDIQAHQLESELLKYKGAKNVISVLVDAVA